MSRMVLLNDQIIEEAEATVSVFDRGFLFADSVYEGLGVLDGEIVDYVHHMQRLQRSLREVSSDYVVEMDSMFERLMTLIERGDVVEGFLYLQVTRGVAERDYVYDPGMDPTVVAFTQAYRPGTADMAPKAVTMRSAPDLRWGRRDIKTNNLLAQVMAKQAARRAGDDEALLIDEDGYVTEGGSSSFFVVSDGVILTTPISDQILPGVTRRALLAMASADSIQVEERRFDLEDVFGADEALMTAASTYVQPVVMVDGRMIGTGLPGPVTLAVRQAYLRYARASFYRPG